MGKGGERIVTIKKCSTFRGSFIILVQSVPLPAEVSLS